MIRRSWFDLLWVLTGSLFLAVLDFRVMDFHPVFMAGFSFVGMAALAVLGTHTIWAEGDERKLLLYGFLPAVLFVGSEYMASTLLDITERLHPKTFDLFLFSFDCSLRVQFSFLMGQLFWTWLVGALCLPCYLYRAASAAWPWSTPRSFAKRRKTPLPSCWRFWSPGLWEFCSTTCCRLSGQHTCSEPRFPFIRRPSPT